VRNLAEQSRNAALQIREAIDQTKQGQTALTKTEQVITGLGTVLTDTSDRVRQISGASIQQSAGIKQISDAMGNLSQGGRDTAATSQQIKDAASELTQVSQQLANLIHGSSDLKKIHASPRR
jgi:methyl-accepting chemotaxis protein